MSGAECAREGCGHPFREHGDSYDAGHCLHNDGGFPPKPCPGPPFEPERARGRELTSP